MLFNSYSFIIFLPVVFLLYWFVANKNYTTQNILLLVASYYFYSCWDYRFLSLLIFSTALDYLTGIKIAGCKFKKQKKIWLLCSIIINLGLLGVFKYYDFFVTSFADVLSILGLNIHPTLLNVLLPVGISFYTFHGLSYVLDIYHDRISAEKNFVDYSLFVSFFPLLVAGPIERATHLLPQIKKQRVFNYTQSVNGLRQILWGFFKKLVVADNCAIYVNAVFFDYHNASTIQLVLSPVLFAFQIYGDFSGYSDIASGTAKLFGIELLRNFNYPFFSRSVSEFWRRWHISLSGWLRDYVYIPLGGSRGGKLKQVKNVFIIFIISGIWHGANWTYLVTLVLHAVYIMPSVLLSSNKNNLGLVAKNRILPTFKEFLGMIITLLLFSFSLIFFRSSNLHEAFAFIQMFGNAYSQIDQLSITYPITSILIMLIFEWLNRANDIPFKNFTSLNARRFVYVVIMLLIFFMGAFINPRSFIYFQF